MQAAADDDEATLVAEIGELDDPLGRRQAKATLLRCFSEHANMSWCELASKAKHSTSFGIAAQRKRKR